MRKTKTKESEMTEDYKEFKMVLIFYHSCSKKMRRYISVLGHMNLRILSYILNFFLNLTHSKCKTKKTTNFLLLDHLKSHKNPYKSQKNT